MASCQQHVTAKPDFSLTHGGCFHGFLAENQLELKKIKETEYLQQQTDLFSRNCQAMTFEWKTMSFKCLLSSLWDYFALWSKNN